MLPDWQIEALYKNLGKRIKALREEKKYKQAPFAQLLKLSRASLVNIEQGRQHPPLHNLYEIARQLEIPIHELLPESIFEPDEEVRKQYEEVITKRRIKSKSKLLEFINESAGTIKK